MKHDMDSAHPAGAALGTRIRRALTTPAVIPDGDRLKTNLDTDFLKCIAAAAMLIDHTGGALFPEAGIFRWAGRLAFPIFCYCLTAGLLYTRDVKKYLLRLGVFALVSQPFYILAFHPVGEFRENLTNRNIFFTLFLSLLAMAGLKERKRRLFAPAFFTVSWLNLDYSGTGIQLMLIFYLCRNHPGAGAVLLYAQLSPRPLGRRAGGSPVSHRGRSLRGLVYFRPAGASFDLLPHPQRGKDEPLVFLRLLPCPSGADRAGPESSVRKEFLSC